MRLLIDTNIYLNFYRMSDESLPALQEILKAMKEEDRLELLVPIQVEREFWRNKNTVARMFANDQEKIMKAIPSLNAAPILQHTKEVKDINASRERLLGRQKGFLEKYEKRVTNPKSKLNLLIEKLFQDSTRIEESKEILKRANRRYLRKDPPRKRKNDESLGDAIIWETLLDQATNEELYIIVTSDGDWVDPMDKARLNELMMREWKEKNGDTKVIRYSSLSEFVKKHLRVKETVIESALEEESELGRRDSIFVSGSPNMDSGVFNTASAFPIFPSGGETFCGRCGKRRRTIGEVATGLSDLSVGTCQCDDTTIYHHGVAGPFNF